ncbi:MAG: M20 family metallopeptidase [Bacteroidales bacterium]|nr:M20 family metallopeptidase [Bacteroidales bacterium]MBN2632918.1 M20 family metallopeptidase [Bacteroidales bacterium]
MDVISLTQELISFNNINPPGNEATIARYTGALLEENGFRTSYFPYGDNRLHLVAEKGLSSKKPPLVFSGHFDTVPPGEKKWSVDPFSGKTEDGKIWGRGSSDMKGGLAAMICASVEAFRGSEPEGGIRLVITAGEEMGCQGMKHLADVWNEAGKAGAVIIGEPTANLPATGHKGALYLNAVTSGITAHSSMPELGVNAIYKAAGAILRIKDLKFDAERDDLLGYPTINVGKISGGLNINSVPDHAEFTVDIRTTTKTIHEEVLEKLQAELGSDVVIEKLVDLLPVRCDEDDPFVQLVYDICGVRAADERFPRAMSYLTDGAVLQRLYSNIPIVILGPGQPELAHQTDEYCFIDKLEEAVSIYKKIIEQR